MNPDTDIDAVIAAIREALTPEIKRMTFIVNKTTANYDGIPASSAICRYSEACSPANMARLLAHIDALRAERGILGKSVDALAAQAEKAEAAWADAFAECEAIARKRAEPTECEHGHVEWDTNAFVCTHRGDCLCIERQEEAEAIADAIAARAPRLDNPSNP